MYPESHSAGLSSFDYEAYPRGLDDIGLVNSQVEAYSKSLQKFYANLYRIGKLRPSMREVEAMLKGAIFALGTYYQNNPAWQQHCATSLREIFVPWNDVGQFRSHICAINSQAEISDEEYEYLKKFWCYYGYFSGIDHHDTEMVMSNLKFIIDESPTQQMCSDDTIFHKITQDFFHQYLPQTIHIIEKGTLIV